MLHFIILFSTLFSVATANVCETQGFSTRGYICKNYQRRCTSKGTPKDQCDAKQRECTGFNYACYVQPLVQGGVRGPGIWTMCCDGADVDRSREFVTGYGAGCSFQELDSQQKGTPIYYCGEGETNFDFNARI